MQQRQINHYIKLVQKELTPNLLSKDWKCQSSPLEGHCYVAAEALYHLIDSKNWKPMVASYVENGRKVTHWWLEHKTTKIKADPTKEQYYPDEPPYSLGRGTGFLTKRPSKRAKTIIDKIIAKT